MEFTTTCKQTGHHDWISSMLLCQGVNPSDWYVVSGSRDGVIKLWV